MNKDIVLKLGISECSKIGKSDSFVKKILMLEQKLVSETRLNQILELMENSDSY